MAEVSRRQTLRTQTYEGFHKHPPDGTLKDYPHPKLAPERKPLRSSVIVSVQSGFVNAVYLAFGRADAKRMTESMGTAICLGNPQDELVPETPTREAVTVGVEYASFFKRLNSKAPRVAGKLAQGITLMEPIPAGVWLAFIPDKPRQPYGILNVSDGKGVNRVFFFPSKAHGIDILAECDQISHGNVPRLIEESALPKESKEQPIVITGDLADWITALELLSRP